MDPRRTLIRTALPALAMAMAVGGCSSSTGATTVAQEDGTTASGTTITIADNNALAWDGGGDYGAVLAHGAAFDAASWEKQATAMADQGVRVVALEDLGGGSISAAINYLQGEGATAVALVGGSAGADSILSFAAENPEAPDRLILLSPNGVVNGLGPQPKLFIASEDEPGVDVSRELAATAAGDDNEALIVPGSAHAQNMFDSPVAEQVMAAILDNLVPAEAG